MTHQFKAGDRVRMKEDCGIFKKGKEYYIDNEDYGPACPEAWELVTSKEEAVEKIHIQNDPSSGINYLVLKIDINALSEIKGQLEEKEDEEEKSVWNLKYGEDFYILCVDGHIDYQKWQSHDFQKRVREVGNAFLTREAADVELEWRKNRAKDCYQGLTESK